MIERAYIEVDGGYGDSPPYQVKAFLVLEGDFVDGFDEYLRNETGNSVSLQISRKEAEELHKSLTEVLYGD